MQAYLDDMAALGVKDPDVMTRVTEYVPQIIEFVQKIVDKGLAYKGGSGSVYLDIDAFKTQGHHYRKLSPFSGDTSAADMAEGEGEPRRRRETASVEHCTRLSSVDS